MKPLLSETNTARPSETLHSAKVKVEGVGQVGFSTDSDSQDYMAMTITECKALADSAT